MRICVPTENENGLEAAVCAHFGSTPFFSVLDIESEEVESIQNANQHHEHGTFGGPLGEVVRKVRRRSPPHALGLNVLPVSQTYQFTRTFIQFPIFSSRS